MSTTALLIEFFIIGLQTFIWLLMLVFLVLYFDWISLYVSKFLSPVIIIFIAPLVCPVGLFIDDVADLLKELKKDLKYTKTLT